MTGLPTNAAALHFSVVNVVLTGAQKQMVWIDAVAHVAFVADKHTLWDGAKVKLPRVPVSTHSVVSRSYQSVPSVTGPSPLAAPQPAPVCLFYLFPKRLD